METNRMHGLSLLDRLVHRGPGDLIRSPRIGSRAIQFACDGVRRDLENLLNARWRCVPWPKDLDQLKQSLVSYGIPDFTGMSFSNPLSQREFCRIIEKTIEIFEPRLRGVTVSMRDKDDPQDRTLRFQIEAVLPIGDVSEPVVFDTFVDPTTSNVKVGRGRR